MSRFNINTEFDTNFIERPQSVDEMKNYLEFNLKKLEEIYKLDEFSSGLEVIKLKLIIGLVYIYFNSLDKAEEFLLAAHEEAKVDKLAAQLFESKMYLGFLYYYQNRYYKCDEFLQKCLTVATKSSALKLFLPKIYLYLALNKKAQREVSKQFSFAQLGLNSCIDNGNLGLLDVCKRLLTN